MENILTDINQKCWEKEIQLKCKITPLINNVCTTIIQGLKNDELFNYLFRGPLYTGSYYEGLKKKKTDEYEINLVLVLPKVLQQQSQMHTKAYPGMAKLNLADKWDWQNNEMFEQITTTLFNKTECNDVVWWTLDCLKVNEWFEGLTQKVLNTNRDDNYDDNKITMEKYAATKTLIINKYICLDLVPCFEFDLDLKPLRNYNQRELIKHEDKYYLLVPKISYDRIPDCPELYWRVSFPKQEQQCLKNLNTLKAAVRLLTLLRDDGNHKILCSYFIQTVAMHHVRVIRSSERFPYWNISETFLDLLESLIQSVTNRKIPFFWLGEFNLLANCSQIYLQDLEEFLKRLKLRILQDPKYITKYVE